MNEVVFSANLIKDGTTTSLSKFQINTTKSSSIKFDNRTYNVTYYVYEYEEDFLSISKDPKFIFVTTALWILIQFIGILANLCVISVTFCSSRKKSATQYFITNLAISDSLFLLISPTLALTNMNDLINYDEFPHILAEIICKTDYFLTHVCSVYI